MKSGFERSFAHDLKVRGIKFEYEVIKLPYTIDHVYNPDFKITDYGFIIETKGVLSVEDRQKMKAIKKKYPDIDIRFVFMKAGTRIKHGKMTNEQWAGRNGFMFAFETIPEEWLIEQSPST